jgi:hypothetical protein
MDTGDLKAEERRLHRVFAKSGKSVIVFNSKYYEIR